VRRPRNCHVGQSDDHRNVVEPIPEANPFWGRRETVEPFAEYIEKELSRMYLFTLGAAKRRVVSAEIVSGLHSGGVRKRGEAEHSACLSI
jgi:hypothetical protein